MSYKNKEVTEPELSTKQAASSSLVEEVRRGKTLVHASDAGCRSDVVDLDLEGDTDSCASISDEESEDVDLEADLEAGKSVVVEECGQEDNSERSQANNQPSELRVACWRLLVLSGFSFVSSYANVDSLVHLRLFTSMMTGNMLYLGISFAQAVADPNHKYKLVPSLEPYDYVAAIATNAFGAFVAWYIVSRDVPLQEKPLQLWQRKSYRVAFFSLVMMLLGTVIYKTSRETQIISTIFWSGSFGAQQIFTTANKELGMSTIFMTGNLHAISSLPAKKAANKRLQWTSWVRVVKDFATPFCVVLSMFVGAIVGGFLTLDDGRSVDDMVRPAIVPAQFILYLLAEHMVIVPTAQLQK